MIYRKLDAAGDYSFGANKNSYLSGAAAVRQAVVTRLKLLIYEWWEDLADGVPLWQKIINARDIKAAQKIISDRIRKTKYVKSIISLETDWDNENRIFTIRAVIDTEFGRIELEEGGGKVGLF